MLGSFEICQKCKILKSAKINRQYKLYEFELRKLTVAYFVNIATVGGMLGYRLLNILLAEVYKMAPITSPHN